MSKLAAFVMTFDRPEALRGTLGSLLAQSRPPEKIVVIDNGGSAATAAVIEGLGDPRVTHVRMHENLGPAGAAACGLRSLSEEGYDWIYWGDDDDPPQTPDTLQKLLDLCERGGATVGAAGAVGTRWDWSRGRTVRLPDEMLAGTLEVDVIAGSSQLVISGAAARSVGLPDARLFFGFEEPEYCLRLRQAGYRLLVDGGLMHQYRAAAGRLHLRSPRVLCPRRSFEEIWRQYYSTRNYIFAMRNSFGRGDLARREALRAVARMVASWARGPRYATRYWALQWRAIRDGYAGRLGQTVRPERKAVD